MMTSKEKKIFTLGDLCTVSQGLAINSKTNHLLAENGIPLLRITDLINNKVEQYIDFKNAPEKCKVLKGDIIYTRTGQVGLVFNNRDGVLHNNCFNVKPDESLVDKSFLYWFLSQNKIREYANNIASGSVQKDLNHSSFTSIPITLPNLRTQRIAVNILNTIRQKIELIEEKNKILQKMINALFSSWFVKFEPVRAKFEGKSTSLPQKIIDLFPDSFENSSLGEIPKGWKVTNLSNVIDFLEGPGIRNWQYTHDDTGIRFINIKCINNVGDLILDNANRISEKEATEKYPHFALEEDDIVVSTSGTLGRYAVVRRKHLPLNLNTSVIRFRPIKKRSTLHYLIGFVQTQLKREIEIKATGSAQLNFGPMHLKQIEMIVPPMNLLLIHQNMAEPLFRKRQLNLDEIDLLSTLRDTLLPKLLSGNFKYNDI